MSRKLIICSYTCKLLIIILEYSLGDCNADLLLFLFVLKSF